MEREGRDKGGREGGEGKGGGEGVDREKANKKEV